MYPVAIGGVGGSGTRTVAAFLEMLGYFVGDDLNEAIDNLWFTLLFKRRSIVLDSSADFFSLVSLFRSRMTGNTNISSEDRARIFALAQHDRLQHPRNWLLERAHSFANGKTSKREGQPWCWKEPNTHVVIDRILACDPGLRYIHVIRHPLDMALSNNQNQLQTWGPLFLNRDVTIEPGLSLTYWCMAHRRVLNLMRAWPDRIMIIDFDALCMTPDPYCTKIATFLCMTLPDDVLIKFRKFVRCPDSTGRNKNIGIGNFDPCDLAYLEEIGYNL